MSESSEIFLYLSSDEKIITREKINDGDVQISPGDAYLIGMMLKIPELEQMFTFMREKNTPQQNIYDWIKECEDDILKGFVETIDNDRANEVKDGIIFEYKE